MGNFEEKKILDCRFVYIYTIPTWIQKKKKGTKDDITPKLSEICY